MADDTLTLVLNGEVPLPAFATAVDGFQDLVAALSNSLARKARIDWVVTDLELAGSALATVTGAPPEGGEYAAVQSVVRAYENVGDLLRRGAPFAEYPKTVERSARRIVSVLNGRVKSVRFETEQTEAEVQSGVSDGVSMPSLAAARLAPRDLSTLVSYGSVRGRVQTMSSRNHLRFTLYDINADRAVSCYLEPGSEERMRKVWGKLAVVEGIVRRDPLTGQPMTVRQVKDIHVVDDKPPGDWRRALNSIPYVPGRVSAVEAIRRGRDE